MFTSLSVTASSSLRSFVLSSKMGKDSSCVFLRVSAVSGLVNGAMCRRMLSHSIPPKRHRRLI